MEKAALEQGALKRAVALVIRAGLGVPSDCLVPWCPGANDACIVWGLAVWVPLHWRSQHTLVGPPGAVAPLQRRLEGVAVLAHAMRSAELPT